MDMRHSFPAGASDHPWTSEDSAELYGVERWGGDFFSVGSAGNIDVWPKGPTGAPIDLHSLVGDLRRRGVRTPMLLRFSDILAQRVAGLCGAFASAIEEYDYPGRFRGVYPIKVNQQRKIVDAIVRFGAPMGVGLEAGSKPELLIALAVLDTRDALIICNGYKDRDYVETALLAQRLGRTPIIVIDRFRELDLVIRTARELSMRPHIGVRARLTARGAGRWAASTGRRSKFGLTPDEIAATVERLREEGMLDCLELVHSHIGSQITAIGAHKEALREVSRIYVGLHKMGARPKLLDVGGGLAVEYEGLRTQLPSAMNYSLQEYANDVVSFVQEACEADSVPMPDIVTESGRAMVAHSSVLVFDVLEVNEVVRGPFPEPLEDDAPKILHDLWDVLQLLVNSAEGDDVAQHIAELQEAYNDAMQLREEVQTLFSLGYLNLADRARAERLALFCCAQLLSKARRLESVPEDLAALEVELADTYYANFSVFQSAPDHWAVDQLFPVMPIHRLSEEPTRRGVFADLTCDSDGRMDRFIGESCVKEVLELHAPNGAPYLMGVFLVGAYQEILGDLHNLFGDTDAVHVRLDDHGYSVEHVVEGDDVSDVLRYVEYEPKELIERVRRASEDATREGKLEIDAATELRKRYEAAMRDYTYLSLSDEPG